MAGQEAPKLTTMMISRISDMRSHGPITLATLKACDACGLKIPDDLSIMAYDDSAWLEYLKISAITHPMQLIGDNMADLLFRDVEAYQKGEEPDSEQISIKPYLLLRQSVRKL